MIINKVEYIASKTTKKQVSLNSIIFLLLTGFLLSAYLLPQVQLFVGLDILMFLTFIYYLFYIAFKRKKARGMSLRMVSYLLPYLLLMYIVANAYNFHYGFLVNFMRQWVYLFPALMFLVVIERNNSFEINVLLLIIFIFLIYSVVVTLIEMQINPSVMRSITNGDFDEDTRLMWKALGIGGYGLAYSSGMLSVVFFSMYKKISYGQRRWILLFASIVAFLFMARTLFTTLLLITFASLLLIQVQSYSGKDKKILYVLAVGVVSGILSFILPFFIDLYRNDVVGDRLIELYNYLYGNGQLGIDLGYRINARNECISLFWSSPFIGNCILGANELSYREAHSTFWAVAMSTGVVGLISYYYTWWYSFVYSYRKIFFIPKQFYLPLAFFMLLLSILNPSEVREISTCFFLICPLLLYKSKQMYGINRC